MNLGQGITVVIALLMLTSLLPSFGVLVTYRAAQSWPTTSAIVEGADLPVNWKSGTVRAPIYCPFTYRYTVDDQQFRSDQVSFDDGLNSTNLDHRCLLLVQQGFPEVGDRISIFYAPGHPQKAVYLRVFPSESLRQIRFSGFVIAIMIALFVLGARQNRREQKARRVSNGN